MPQTSSFAISVYNVTNASYTAVIIPINCNAFGIRPSADIYISTTGLDADADTIAGGVQDYTTSPWIFPSSRFHVGETLCYIKGVSGSARVSCQFVT